VERGQLICLRNAEHDIPEICDGAYAAFLDRHGQRSEYFPHAMLRRLESERQKRCSPSSSPASLDSASSSASPPEDVSKPKSSTPGHVWLVAQTHQGGYERFRPVADPSGAGGRVRFHGVFGSPDDANVKAMETFQKLHRDFMLCGAGSRSVSSLGFGLLGSDGLGFLEMPDDTGAAAVEVSAGAFSERHPAPLERWVGGDGEDDVEGASWWLDAAGCLSLRARNWGTGDSRIFVVRQEFSL
jgi:hypothetical protein